MGKTKAMGRAPSRWGPAVRGKRGRPSYGGPCSNSAARASSFFSLWFTLAVTPKEAPVHSRASAGPLEFEELARPVGYELHGDGSEDEPHHPLENGHPGLAQHPQ